MPYLNRIHVNALLRNDLSKFIHRCFLHVVPGDQYYSNWHLKAIAWHLSECLRGRIKRLLITIPPRSLKSISASVAFPAWALGHDPTCKFICASYSEDLAAKFARDTRAVMASDWYRKIFPRTRFSRERNAELDFMTTKRGFRLSTSVGGTLTGRGGNLIIIDDPLKPQDAMSDALRESTKQWYENTLYSRLDNKSKDIIILIMQRLHMDDLAGHVLEKEKWIHLNLPAIAEEAQRILIGEDQFYDWKKGELLHAERESMETLENIKNTIGTFNFSAQYLQSPIPIEGNLLKWEWFEVYPAPSQKERNDQVVQSWDTASKAGELNDFSVCTTWLVKGNHYYLLHVLRERLEFPFLKKRVIELSQKFEADTVLIEDKGSGTQLIQDLQSEGALHPIAIEPEGDKITRMSAQSAKIEAGQVFLPESASWLPEFQKEILQFPNGKYDDQVDSMSQFLGWAKPHRIWRISTGGQRMITRDTNWH